MNIEITLKNYRCFPDSSPATFQLRPGFTAFVGANNSGKTSLLRFLYEFRDLFRIHSTPSGPLIAALRRNPQAFNLANTVLDQREIFHNGNERDLEIEVDLIDAVPNDGLPARPVKCTLLIPHGTNQYTWDLHLTDGLLDLSKGEINFGGPQSVLLKQGDAIRCDLTPLFKAFADLSQTLYIGPFRNAINVGATSDYYDIQVGQAFIAAWKGYKSGVQLRLNERAYRVEKDIQRIFGLSEIQINPSANEQTLQLLLNGRSFKLSEVGSGMTQFILVLANVAMRQQKYILLDEPELGLHPSLQLDFLTTLASYVPGGGVLFATHNIGLARSTAERILSVTKVSDFVSRIRPLESTPRLSEFLGELSFGGYKELGFDKILLVEGPKDVVAVQQLLRTYGKDHKVVILPMGGSSLINGTNETELQLQELKRISGNIFALIDSERNSTDDSLPSARLEFLHLCKAAEVHCHVLERRAMENYWSEPAIQKIKGIKYGALLAYQKLESVPQPWAKSENWLIAREMTMEDLNQTDLGAFLAAL